MNETTNLFPYCPLQLILDARTEKASVVTEAFD